MALDIGNIKNTSFLKSAWKWISDAYRKIFSGQPPDPNSGLSVVNEMEVGHMYLFGYDAKHKDTLPYWDARPLIIYMGNSKRRPNHFLGMNLHYLHPSIRMRVFQTLDTIQENDKYNDQVKFQASYEYLQGMASFAELKPCIKEYIPDHVFKGYYMKVDPKHWNRILVLPEQQWRSNTGHKHPY
jgi:hypothetical protein